MLWKQKYKNFISFFISEKQNINNNKTNEDENKTIDNLIENSEKKPTESIQTGNLGYSPSKNT